MTQRLMPTTAVPREPVQPWVWSQSWEDLLFLHWRVSPELLSHLVPCPLQVETFDGQAWVSLVLFRLRVRPRWLPFLPGLSTLLEANLRTYVQLDGRPGIWFLSVHADNRWAIWLARLLTPLPYRRARISCTRLGPHAHFQIQCPGSPSRGVSLSFIPGPVCAESVDGTLDAWLLERYRLYLAQGRREQLLQADVVHPRWQTAPLVELSCAGNNLGEAFGLDLSRAPDRAHFSPGVQALFGPFRNVEETGPSPCSQRPTLAPLPAPDRTAGALDWGTGPR
jgi:uncharacterized protein YqjF (DUF2071 family)